MLTVVHGRVEPLVTLLDVVGWLAGRALRAVGQWFKGAVVALQLGVSLFANRIPHRSDDGDILQRVGPAELLEYLEVMRRDLTRARVRDAM